ncbi:hypothetical protein MAPG_11790 [Magnaporthiopsis poae ATCC 64411]|uniref:Uncharacterized protein n=1 Tax=Magnaporthiopsis poae (strain ATCC 64411 / 73-15) TaxID=644358 RepID=A0A0C4EG67_MAGP6|nr:hypothetical protein MAPG_11790 [Magnaporthiopsis poae ATCC 64411]
MDPSAAARASPRVYSEAAVPLQTAGYQLPQQRGYPEDGRAAVATPPPPLSMATAATATAQGGSPTRDWPDPLVQQPLSSHVATQSPLSTNHRRYDSNTSQHDLAFRDLSRYPQPEPASYPVGVMASFGSVSSAGYEAAPPRSRGRSQSVTMPQPRMPSRPPSAHSHRRTPFRPYHTRGPSEDYASPWTKPGP